MKKLIAALLCLSALSLLVGVGHISPTQLFQGQAQAWEMLLTIRLPRLCAILLSGGALCIAGLIMQQIGQNRFASPSTTGTTDCAVLGYVLGLVFFQNGEQLWLIFACAMAGTWIFIIFIQKVQFKNTIFVPLIGIIYGNIVQSGTTFLAYKFDVIQSLHSWTVANFATILSGNYELLYLAIPAALFAYAYATRISAAGMGKDFAINLGLNYQHVLLIGIMLVSIVAAMVLMIVGEMQFLGLIIPNLVSFFYGDHLRKNIPRTAILGALFVLACDILGRVIIFPYEMPISMMINLFGGLLFILFIVKGGLHERSV